METQGPCWALESHRALLAGWGDSLPPLFVVGIHDEVGQYIGGGLLKRWEYWGIEEGRCQGAGVSVRRQVKGQLAAKEGWGN